MIPDLVGALLGPPAAANRTLHSRKGSVWVLSFAEADRDDGDRGALRVVAADHYADPAA